MTTLVASGYPSDSARNNTEMKDVMENFRDKLAESPGGVDSTTLTIASGVIVVPAGDGGGWHLVETQGSAASDDLTNIDLTDVSAGRRVVLAPANASHVVTVKHGAGGSGQFLMADDADFVFADLQDWIEFRRTSTDMVEVNRRRVPLQIAPTIDLLTTGTAATYTTPAGAKKLVVECWGAGGGSGGVDGQVGGSAVSGPGGGGGYCLKEIDTPLTSYTYTVGTGGAAGSSGANNGSAGGATTFVDGVSLSMSAGGGNLGAGHTGTAGSSAATGAAGGSSSGGDINLTGGDASGKSVVSGIVAGLPVSGSAPFIGGGVRPSINNAGVAGRVYGEGAGAAHSNDATNYAGAAGAGGLIKVTVYY